MVSGLKVADRLPICNEAVALTNTRTGKGIIIDLFRHILVHTMLALMVILTDDRLCIKTKGCRFLLSHPLR
jgi:hypothetical protein